MIALLAFANASPDTGSAQKELSRQMGKDVPAKFVCMKTQDANGPLSSPITVVGVKLKDLGCTRKAIAVGDTWTPSAEGLAAASNWSSLDSSGREKAALNFVRAWTAFQPHWEGDPKSSTSGSKVVVEGTFSRRTRQAMVSETVEGTWTFDRNGTMDEKENITERIERRLVLSTNRVKGLEAEQVTASLEAVGKLFERCFAAAWRRNPSLNQRTRLSWTVSNTKATGIAVSQQSSPALSQCYANALSKAEFPADGTVDMDFGISKRTPSAPKK